MCSFGACAISDLLIMLSNTSLLGAHLSADLHWVLVVFSLKLLTCRIWKNHSLAMVVHRFDSGSFLVLRMPDTIMSHKCNSKSYQQVTTKSELISHCWPVEQLVLTLVILILGFLFLSFGRTHISDSPPHLTWVQNGPVGFWKNMAYKNNNILTAVYFAVKQTSKNK
jgi:hypothetical protein